MSELTDLFSSIAGAIRGKTGETASIPATDFANAISNIPAGESVKIGTVATLGNQRSCTIPQIGNYENFVLWVIGGISAPAHQDGKFLYMAKIGTTTPYRAYILFNQTNEASGVQVTPVDVNISGDTITFASPSWSFPTASGQYIAW